MLEHDCWHGILAKLDAIDALAAKATEGPWGYDRNHTVAQSEDEEWGPTVCQIPGSGGIGRGRVMPSDACNADFIAASRAGWPATTVKALIVAVEAIQPAECERIDGSTCEERHRFLCSGCLNARSLSRVPLPAERGAAGLGCFDLPRAALTREGVGYQLAVSHTLRHAPRRGIEN